MKRLFKLFILSVLTLAFAITAFACGGGDNADGEKGIICKKLTGDEFYTVYDYVAEDDVTSLDIAKAVKEKYGDDAVVGRINVNSFAGDESLKELIVPSSVVEIRAGAFQKMRSLEKITLPFVGRTAVADSFMGETGEGDKSVDSERLFAYVFGTEEYTHGSKITTSYNGTETTDYYIPYSLYEVTIAPKDAGYKIPAYAFNGVNQITTINLTENVKEIGINAFENAKSLYQINLPASIDTIRESAFNGAINLTKLEIAERTDKIKAYENAFKGCEKLNESVQGYFDCDLDKVFDVK